MKSFKNIMGSDSNLEQRISQIKQQVINDSDVKQF